MGFGSLAAHRFQQHAIGPRQRVLSGGAKLALSRRLCSTRIDLRATTGPSARPDPTTWPDLARSGCDLFGGGPPRRHHVNTKENPQAEPLKQTRRLTGSRLTVTIEYRRWSRRRPARR